MATTPDVPAAGRSLTDGRDALVTYLTRQQSAMVAMLPGVRAKDVDAVHDMRIAVRRIRSTLRTFRPAFDRARSEWLRVELRWLAELLGAVRDTDVMFARLANAIANEPDSSLVEPIAVRIRKQLRATARFAHAALATALTGARYRRLTVALASFINSRLRPMPTAVLHRLAGAPLHRADRLLDRAAASVAHDSEALHDSEAVHDSEALHEARRAYKRARYAIEVLIPGDGDLARALAKRLSALQEVLGAHQDAMVTAALLRDYGQRAHDNGENAFGYGLLYGRQLAAADRALTGLDRARERARAPRLRAFLQTA